MIVFVATLVLALISLIIGLIIECNCKYTYIENNYILDAAVAFIFIFFLEVICLFISYVDKESTFNQLEQERIAIQYQLDYGVFEPLNTSDNYDNNEKMKLYEKAEDFNRELAINKARKHNIFISLFYMADYDAIDYVVYPERDSWLNKADGTKKYDFNLNIN